MLIWRTELLINKLLIDNHKKKNSENMHFLQFVFFRLKGPCVPMLEGNQEFDLRK